MGFRHSGPWDAVYLPLSLFTARRVLIQIRENPLFFVFSFV